MIRRLLIYEGSSYDPYRNLAIEESLLGQADGCAILYLWQNENTVVIGKNQNPWKECKTALLREEGGKLARRLSGGGAVFHDLGNLNFTFLLPQEDFGLDRQFAVIQKAVESLGIHVKRSGRNDILADGRKFSGNAFYKNGIHAYHHGTLLLNADMEKMGRYLSPSELKLQAKGVDSVRSRVENLSHWKPDITISGMKEALKQAFSGIFGLPLENLSELNEEQVSALTARNESWEWNYGRKIPFDCCLENRFPWGSIEIAMAVQEGKITEVRVFTDSMDQAWTYPVELALQGSILDEKTISRRLAGLEHGQELCALFHNV